MATAAQLRYGNVVSFHGKTNNTVEVKKSAFLGGGLVNFKGKLSSSSSLCCKGNVRTGGGGNISRTSCALMPKVQKKTLLHELYEQQGQSPWYDNLRRPVSDLKPLIENGVRGITSNPTIFEKAIISSDAYDEQFRKLIKEGKEIEVAYWELVIKDIQDACELFEPIYDESDGADGYVSVEVSPRLAHDTEQTIEAAKWLHKRVDRRNVYIKIPATAECIPAIKKVISLGISVNVTLIFSLPRYEAVMDAYVEGLESCEAEDLSKVTSVASFFVSRVDTLVDKKLEKVGTDAALALRGKAATAQAALAYKLYQQKFSGPRWEALEKRGARKQRVLWASTSVKNPAYPDTLYVNPLIGPDSVTTMPDQALQAFIDHGKVARTIDANFEEAQNYYDAIKNMGIDWDEVGSLLEMEGVESFKKSFDSLLVSLGNKADLLKVKSS
uniref:Transaldolase n=1 Tax=Wollemia nobilis TaxID=56998 RepID=A0A0C9S810_9CONI